MWEKIVLLVLGYVGVVIWFFYGISYAIYGLPFLAVAAFCGLFLKVLFTCAVYNEWLPVLRVFQVLHGIGVVRVVALLLYVVIITNESSDNDLYYNHYYGSVVERILDVNETSIRYAVVLLAEHIWMILLIWCFIAKCNKKNCENGIDSSKNELYKNEVSDKDIIIKVKQ